MPELRFVYYSDRTIAVYGDKGKYEKHMKGFGRWNPKIFPVAGWLVKKQDEDLLINLLKSLILMEFNSINLPSR